MQPKRIRLLFLTVFSQQGGIEKFNRSFLKTCLDLEKNDEFQFSAHVVHDHPQHLDTRYADLKSFHGYSGNIINFLVSQLFVLFRNEALVLGHLNLSVVGYLRKLLFPKRKLIVICHGIEVFTPLRGFRKKVLQRADHILAVSKYTKEQLVNLQQVQPDKVRIFPNTIDPFFKLPVNFSKPDYLKKRYGLNGSEKVLFTLTRLNSKEGYKGYDKVLTILPTLLQRGVNVKYILAGKADEAEMKRVNQLLDQHDLKEHVLITGFLPDEEVTDHFLLADAFVMPSMGEGFGIVYIEAMACGLPVIAGNKDGSTEALQFGKLGTLVDPDNLSQITEAVIQGLEQGQNPALLQKKVMEHFSYSLFSERLGQLFKTIV